MVRADSEGRFTFISFSKTHPMINIGKVELSEMSSLAKSI